MTLAGASLDKGDAASAPTGKLGRDHTSRRPGPNDQEVAHYPFTAPAVRPLTIWRWKTMTRIKSGAVIDTAAATATT